MWELQLLACQAPEPSIPFIILIVEMEASVPIVTNPSRILHQSLSVSRILHTMWFLALWRERERDYIAFLHRCELR